MFGSGCFVFVFGSRGWVLLLCASAWVLGLAGLPAAGGCAVLLFDKFCEVLFVVFCAFSPHLACHVPFISTVLSSRLLVRVVTPALPPVCQLSHYVVGFLYFWRGG